ncbi:MAG: DUF433 domain-containing protein [Anaerolineae bacterium]|nr:DUF433 domain-containing protein [Anaerolineae bacterium]
METILDRHITIDPKICHGRPHLQGHRIRVQDIAVWHERLGMSVDDICTDYNLSLAEVYAALAYYFDYKEAIDTAIEADEAFVEAFKKNNPSQLQEKLKKLRGEENPLSS